MSSVDCKPHESGIPFHLVSYEFCKGLPKHLVSRQLYIPHLLRVTQLSCWVSVGGFYKGQLLNIYQSTTDRHPAEEPATVPRNISITKALSNGLKQRSVSIPEMIAESSGSLFASCMVGNISAAAD